MAWLEALVVVGVFAVLVYALISRLTSPRDRPAVAAGGAWTAVHYDVQGVTRVVVQKVSAGGTNVLDEHLVASIAVDDPDYDAKFLDAMHTARERRALFEAEDA